MKNFSLFILLIFTTIASHAFPLDNADIRLLCPQRGQVEVILHRYEHTQESWGKDNFETGGGHSRKGSLLMIQFANMDQMLYEQKTGSFSFWYAEERRLVSCRLLSLTSTYPIDIPYFRE